MPTFDELTLSDLGGRVGRGTDASNAYNLLRTLGSYVAPDLTSVLTEPEAPYRGMIGPGGQLVPTAGGKVPSTEDPRTRGMQQELVDLVSNLMPVGGAAKAGSMLAAGPLLAARRALVAGEPVGLGAFNTTTPRTILGATKKGGYSVRLPTGEKPTEGFMSGIFRNDDPRNLVVEGRQPTLKDIGAFTEKNLKALQNEERYLGTWSDPESGNTYFDVSQRFSPEELRQATKFGERTAQKSIYDVGAGTTRPVGNWEEFIKTPEFHARMNEMAGRGNEYLKQFPSKEWWDMHGGPFEYTYGTQNMPQTAGFTASTAPNTAPIQNLQQMSEYMRRHISGEPVIQPEWRAPEGLMSLQEGRQLPLEQSRVANLEKAARGDIDALRLDKVRNEAQAMMGDPRAVVLDRHWARIAEKPSEGIFTGSQEGTISATPRVNRPSNYGLLKNEVTVAADKIGRDPRDFSADAWTGIRDTIQKTGELFGEKFRGASITGESKSYADHLVDLINQKAAHLRITPKELEKRLQGGDASLLSVMLSSPAIAAAYGQWQAGQNAPASSADNRASAPAL